MAEPEKNEAKQSAPQRKRNLTRDSIEGFITSKLVAEGKSPDEATEIAKKQAAAACKAA
jgi:hypothetical protein